MQISVSLVTVIRNIHGIQERHAVAKYTTMDRCFNLEEGKGMNLLTCFNIDLYRDALYKIGNGMHRYSQLSSCAHAGNANRSQNYLSTADCCLLTRTLTRGPDGDCSFDVEENFGLGLSLFEK